MDHSEDSYITWGEGEMERAQNHCRAPDDDKAGVWCFASNARENNDDWDYCPVPKCGAGSG